MTTAFQSTAFQNDAFQIGGAVAQPVTGGGRLNLDVIRSLRFGREREQAVEPPVEVKPLPVKPDYAAQYNRKMAKLAAAIKRLNAKADANLAQIAQIEAMEQRRQNEKRIARELLLKQQERVLIAAQQAALMEEMEVLDIAFVAVVAITIH